MLAWWTVRKLKSPDPQTIEAAQERLVQSRSVSTLVRALKDPEMRKHAAQALYQIDGPPRDLISLMRYWEHLAREYWKTRDPHSPRVCDLCGLFVERGEGYLNGFLRDGNLEGFMYCPDCCCGKVLQPRYFEPLANLIATFSLLGDARNFARAEAAHSRKTIPMVPANLFAICLGLINFTTDENEAFQMSFDLLDRWNPRIFEAVKRGRPNAKMRVFHASSLQKLLTIFDRLFAEEYPTCNVVIQTGTFLIGRISTQSRAGIEVALATVWKNDTGSNRVVIAAGMDLEIQPV